MVFLKIKNKKKVWISSASAFESVEGSDDEDNMTDNILDLVICPITSAKPHRLLLANPQNFPISKTLSTL